MPFVLCVQRLFFLFVDFKFAGNASLPASYSSFSCLSPHSLPSYFSMNSGKNICASFAISFSVSEWSSDEIYSEWARIMQPDSNEMIEEADTLATQVEHAASETLQMKFITSNVFLCELKWLGISGTCNRSLHPTILCMNAAIYHLSCRRIESCVEVETFVFHIFCFLFYPLLPFNHLHAPQRPCSLAVRHFYYFVRISFQSHRHQRQLTAIKQISNENGTWMPTFAFNGNEATHFFLFCIPFPHSTFNSSTSNWCELKRKSVGLHHPHDVFVGGYIHRICIWPSANYDEKS